MMKPIILLEGKNSLEELEELKKQNNVWKIVDIYNEQLKELFEINHPELLKEVNFEQEQNLFVKENFSDSLLKGSWIYFPWSGVLLHTLTKDDLYLLRTNRNKNLITLDEQNKLADFTVGVVGLSVGSNIALNLVYQGIANRLKLAEYDLLETSNLNRVKASLQEINQPKIDFITKQIYELNPFAELTLFNQGLTAQNIRDFVNGDPKPKLIFEIIDNFELKILLRIEARKAGIPVIMMANLGDNVLVDIERFDLDKELPILNGLLGDLPERILEDPNADPHQYAVKIVGIENVPKRALESVKNIGKTLVGRPQLSSTVSISGGLGAYLTRRVALGKKLPSGRKKVSLDSIFDLENDLDI